MSGIFWDTISMKLFTANICIILEFLFASMIQKSHVYDIMMQIHKSF